MSSSPTRDRVLRRLAVAFGFGLMLSFVPLPGMVFTTASVGASTPMPTLEPASGDDLAAVQAAADEPVGTDRVSGADVSVNKFTTIGLTFDTPPDQPVFVRVKDRNGAFGEWRELAVEADEGPDGSTDAGTEPLWVGDGTGYEVNLGTRDATHADVVVVRDEQRRSTTVATPAAGAAAPTPFGIGSRASWGARAATSTSYGSTVRLAVVHHSVSSNDYSPADVPGILRSIQAYHMDGRGWSDIAYNFVVDKFGGIWEGRGGGIDQPVIGAHAMGFNTNSVGVMVIGDYSAVAPTAASLESVSQVIGWKLYLHGANPTGRVDVTSAGSTSIAAGVTVNLPVVVGHQDVGSTGCPGSIQNSLGTIRQRAQDWSNWLRAVSVPTGSLDVVGVGNGVVQVAGWAKDPDIDGPALVRLTVGGVTVEGRTGNPRPDVAAVFPGYGGSTGFDFAATGVPPGFQDMCVTVVNEGWGLGDTSLGCRLVVVGDPTGKGPTGRITAARGFVGGLDVSGVAGDPDGPGPRAVTVEVDGVRRQTVSTGAGNEYSATVLGVTGGRKRLCMIVSNSGVGADTRTDCWSIDVAGASPYGSLDVASLSGAAFTLQGWAFDPESTDPLAVHITYDGRLVWPTAADQPRGDVAAAFPGYGDRRGFRFVVNAPKGRHTVCAVAINVGQGGNNTLGCRTDVVK